MIIDHLFRYNPRHSGLESSSACCPENKPQEIEETQGKKAGDFFSRVFIHALPSPLGGNNDEANWSATGW
jgi:hypothetical protein